MAVSINWGPFWWCPCTNSPTVWGLHSGPWVLETPKCVPKPSGPTKAELSSQAVVQPLGQQYILLGFNGNTIGVQKLNKQKGMPVKSQASVWASFPRNPFHRTYLECPFRQNQDSKRLRQQQNPTKQHFWYPHGTGPWNQNVVLRPPRNADRDFGHPREPWYRIQATPLLRQEQLRWRPALQGDRK